jgi:hypothetical protein
MNVTRLEGYVALDGCFLPSYLKRGGSQPLKSLGQKTAQAPRHPGGHSGWGLAGPARLTESWAAPTIRVTILLMDIKYLY